jgi:hypothetical protein
MLQDCSANGRVMSQSTSQNWATPELQTNWPHQSTTHEARKKVDPRKHQHGIIGTNLSGDPWRSSVASASGPTKSSLQLAQAGWVRCYRARDTRLERTVAVKIQRSLYECGCAAGNTANPSERSITRLILNPPQ